MDGNSEHNVIPIGDTANNVKMTKRWAGYTGNTKIGCKFFPKGGLVINNSTNSDGVTQLVFSAQFHSRQHKHADHLNVLYNFNNKQLLVDPELLLTSMTFPRGCIVSQLEAIIQLRLTP